MSAADRQQLLAVHRKKLLRGKYRHVRYSMIEAPENVRAAAYEASRGKKAHAGVRCFEQDAERNIQRITQMLHERAYYTSPVEECLMKCPCGKQRMLSKLPHDPDHIVHHAMMRVLTPVLNRYYFHDSAASIKGRGMHYAERRVERYIDERRKSNNRLYYIKRDFVKFYHHIQQAVIENHLRQLFSDAGVRYLIHEVVTACREGLGIGLYPIQPYANTYTSPLCREVMSKHDVRVFIYCDDIVIMGTDKHEVWRANNYVEHYAAHVMRQPLHQQYGMQIVDDSHFLDFVGYRFYYLHTGLRKKMKIRFKQKMHRLNNPLRRYQVATAYKGWLMHCNGMHLWQSVTGLENYKALRMPIKQHTNKTKRQAA